MLNTMRLCGRAVAITGTLLGWLTMGAAQAGTIVVGLNETGGVREYDLAGNYLGDPTGPPTVNDPTDFSEDIFGNLYIGSQNNGSIVRIAPDGTVSSYKSGLSALLLIAVGPDGAVYFSRTGGQVVIDRVNLDLSVETVVTTELGARALAFDSSGTLFYSAGSRIFSFDSGASTLLATLQFGVVDMVFNADGNLLATISAIDSIYEIAPDGSFDVFADTGLDRPGGITQDEDGNVYVANADNGTVRKFADDGTDLGNFVTGLATPHSVGYWRATALSTDDSDDIPAPGSLALLCCGLALVAARRFTSL